MLTLTKKSSEALYMSVTNGLQPQKVFEYFEKLAAIPRGSGDMDKIARFLTDFAKNHGLRSIRDGANNVIIFKDGTAGYENSDAVILQGHTDMVCQKTDDCTIDFEKDGLKLYTDGDFLKAEGTTLGADNGIAAAMILAILEDDGLSHPPIEAVFTSDEEIGMVGALALDTAPLNGKMLINVDSEDEDILTVSCAGGSDVKITAPLKRKKCRGSEVAVRLFGLKGGHSGIEIASGRVNANILSGRLLNTLCDVADFEILSVSGGDKGNAIPLAGTLKVVTDEPEAFAKKVCECLDTVKAEIFAREPEFDYSVQIGKADEYDVIGIKKELIFLLACAPNGVLKMSAEIEGLVETSLNLGILDTDNENLTMFFSLRSNKSTALCYLEKKLKALCTFIECDIECSGHYPPWEFKADSKLQEIYKSAFLEQYGKAPKVEAIHAGLECGVFCGKLKDLDCISIGPQLYDVHTVNERLSISSTERVYNLIVNILKNLT